MPGEQTEPDDAALQMLRAAAMQAKKAVEEAPTE